MIGIRKDGDLSHRINRQGLRQRIGLPICFLVASLLLAIYFDGYRGSLEWDLRRPQTLLALGVDPPQDWSAIRTEITGPIQVKIQFDDNLVLDDLIERVHLWIDRERVTGVWFEFAKMELDAVVRKTDELGKKFHASDAASKELAEWIEVTRSRSRPPTAFGKYWRMGTYQYGFRISKSYDPAKPWKIFFVADCLNGRD